MKKHAPSEFEGYEKKPESEWTERDRKLLEHYGVVPLTEEGHRRYVEEVVEKSPEVMKFREVLAQCTGKTPDGGGKGVDEARPSGRGKA